jgi:hypothetical protein
MDSHAADAGIPLREEGPAFRTSCPCNEEVFHQRGINFEVRDKEAVLARLEKKYSDADKVYKLDGLSVEYKDWHFNVRASKHRTAYQAES